MNSGERARQIEIAIGEKASYENRLAEYEEQKKELENIPFVPSKGIMPEYIKFIIFGFLLVPVLCAVNAIIFKSFIPFYIENYGTDGIFLSTYRILGTMICAFLVETILFIWLAGIPIAYSRHRAADYRNYEKMMDQRKRGLRDLFKRLVESEESFHDCFVRLGIPFDTTSAEMRKMIDEAWEAQRLEWKREEKSIDLYRLIEEGLL